jgi:hypothetical protein
LGALKRYYATSYRGVNVWSNPTQAGRIEEERRLIVGYKFVDERKTRYLADKLRTDKESVARGQRQFTQIYLTRSSSMTCAGRALPSISNFCGRCAHP